MELTALFKKWEKKNLGIKVQYKVDPLFGISWVTFLELNKVGIKVAEQTQF
jgi:hypothetical protein